MRKPNLIFIAVALLLASRVASADDSPTGGPTGACKLITQTEIAALDLKIEGEPSEDGVNVPKGVSGAPTDIWSSICTINLGKKGAQFMSVAIHNFSAPVTIEQLDAWEDAKGGYDDITRTRSGDVTCEVGQYDWLSGREGKPPIVQYYVACDQLMRGQQRVVINLQMDEKKSLPAVEKIKNLLETALKHLSPEAKPASAKSDPVAPVSAS
jgi:hypothetical protein